MSEVLDSIFPEPDGEWIGAVVFAKSNQRFKDFEKLKQCYGYPENLAAEIVMSDTCDWSDDVRRKLHGY